VSTLSCKDVSSVGEATSIAISDPVLSKVKSASVVLMFCKFLLQTLPGVVTRLIFSTSCEHSSSSPQHGLDMVQSRHSSRDIPNGQLQIEGRRTIESIFPGGLNAAVWSASCSGAAAFHNIFNVRSFAAG